MASALALGAVVSCAITELIRLLVETGEAVKQCKPECRKLEIELAAIKPDVERLEIRLGRLRTRASNIEHEDTKMVEDWLEGLKVAIELGNIEVHRFNSRRIPFGRKILSGKITSTYNEISKIAADRVSLYLQLGRLVREESGQHGAPVVNGSSYNYGYGSPNSSSGHFISQDSSMHSGYDSSGSSHFWAGSGDDWSLHSSSSGHETLGVVMLRRMSQERNSILQQEDQSRLSMFHFDHYHHPQHERRH